MTYSIPIVAFYAALLSLIFVHLSMRTISLRRSLRIAIGDDSNPLMIRAIRVHANFAEYVPISLLLIYFVEISGAHWLVVHGLALILLSGRCLHAYGLSKTRENFKFRTTGMKLTFTSLILGAVYLLAAYIFTISQVWI